MGSVMCLEHMYTCDVLNTVKFYLHLGGGGLCIIVVAKSHSAHMLLNRFPGLPFFPTVHKRAIDSVHNFYYGVLTSW